MTSTFLASDLERDEGLRLAAYPDPLSGGAPWTIGYGHTGREVHPGLTWTLAQCQIALNEDIHKTSLGLDTALPWWTTLSDLRQDCLCNQAFNMGVHGLMSFTTYLGLVQHGKYAEAAIDEMHTLWANQVGNRAIRLSRQMASGCHQVLP